MTQPSYDVKIRDSTYTIVGQVDTFDRVELNLKFNDVGSIGFTVPASDDKVSLLAQDRSGVLIERNGVVVASGPVRTITRNFAKASDMLEIRADDDLTWIKARNANPTALKDYDKRSGAAETVIKAYVTANAGSGAATDRQVPGLTVAADEGRGSTINGTALYDNLLELLQGLALKGGDLGFRVVQSGLSLVFEVYAIRDLTSTVVFSPDYQNIEQYSYELGGPGANHIVAGGELTTDGDIKTRRYATGTDGASILKWGRIEGFTDASGVDSDTELAQEVASALAEAASPIRLDFAPTTTHGPRFMTDWGLGDKVRIYVDGQAIDNIVRQIQVLWREGGIETVNPTVATPHPYDKLRLFQRVHELEERIRSLETKRKV